MTRILEGNLEDLDLAEVLRVITLSKRVGTLALHTRRGEVEIRVAGGRVYAVRGAYEKSTLADLLIDAGLVSPRAFAVGPDRTLDDVLRAASREMHDPTLFTRAEQVIREAMEESLLVVAELSDGHFAFVVDDDALEKERFPGDTTYAVVDGIEGDALIRALERRQEKRSRDPLARARSTPPTPVEDGDAPTVLVVDDDDRFLTAFAREARAAGIDVNVARSARDALSELDRVAASPHAVALIDLVMPRSTGRGILGGLEVLRAAAERGVADRAFLVVDAPHDDAAVEARALGAAAVLHRPEASASLAPLLNPALARLGRPPIVDEPFDLASELRVELGEADWFPDPDLRLDESARSLEVLRSLLAQVSNPAFEEEIPLVLLRFAAAFFSRGALFGHHAGTGQLVGVGGFGLLAHDPGRAIHALKIPTAADTVFSRALRERAGVRQPAFESEWNNRLLVGLGGPRPREVYTAPLLSPRGIEAVLYADNATSGRPFPDTALLEIFIQQAGAALERSSLKRRVDELLARPEARA